MTNVITLKVPTDHEHLPEYLMNALDEIVRDIPTAKMRVVLSTTLITNLIEEVCRIALFFNPTTYYTFRRWSSSARSFSGVFARLHHQVRLGAEFSIPIFSVIAYRTYKPALGDFVDWNFRPPGKPLEESPSK